MARTSRRDRERNLTREHSNPLRIPEPSLIHVRQLLYDELGLRNLFRGDGFTYDDDGKRGPPEYLARNVPLGEIEGVAVMDVVPSRDGQEGVVAAARESD